MGNYTVFQMFENPRRGRQARDFTTNVPKILDLKSSSEQIFSRKLPLGAPVFRHISHRMAEKITFLKENLCIFKCFEEVLYIFSSVVKKKIQNAPRFEMEFVLNFAMCSADWIHYPDEIASKDKLFGF